MTNPISPPVLFTLGLHAHQPEGNFGHVFKEHLEHVYAPFLRRAMEGGLFPLTLHLSGPLLDWLEKNDGGYLDLLGELVSESRLELLLAGFYEPILPSLPSEDRVEQILWMREALRSRFGVEARGLWLTERVWEPDLAGDLAVAGVDYVLVDDRHFVASGFPRDVLHAPFLTEAGGKTLGVFAIDEKLRYLIPFHAPEDTAAYLRELRGRGCRLAVAADDIEKFGGWPGTREWVYEKGWLERFIRMVKELEEAGEIRLATFSQAKEEIPSGGLVYLPSASYREMEEWTLPPEAYHRMSELKHILGDERFSRGEAPLIRGSHWRNFLVKYPESNRMHKKMLALSGLCRKRGNPEAARKALGRAQCNDAYWHGVFGGLYLRHLRDTIWRHLARAEGLLRKDESLGWEEVDLDMDGHPEIWVHSQAFSALVSPHRGGGVEELTLFGQEVNLANTLTRRREAYHHGGDGFGFEESSEESGNSHGDGSEAGGSGDKATSIHDLEEDLRFSQLPPVDPHDRALFLESILGEDVTEAHYRKGEANAIRRWAHEVMAVEKVVAVAHRGSVSPLTSVSRGEEADEEYIAADLFLAVHLRGPGAGDLRKILTFSKNGEVEVRFAWDPSAFPANAFFTTELSLGADARVESNTDVGIWRFPIETFSKSEGGFDETVQGESVLVRWPVAAGEGSVRIGRG